jgi:hypothetical protein
MDYSKFRKIRAWVRSIPESMNLLESLQEKDCKILVNNTFNHSLPDWLKEKMIYLLEEEITKTVEELEVMGLKLTEEDLQQIKENGGY